MRTAPKSDLERLVKWGVGVPGAPLPALYADFLNAHSLGMTINEYYDTPALITERLVAMQAKIGALRNPTSLTEDESDGG